MNKSFVIFTCLLFLTGCAGLQPTMVDGKDVIGAEKLLFDTTSKELIEATKAATTSLGWSVEYEGEKETRVRRDPLNNSMIGNTRFDRVGINATLRYKRTPTYYMRLRTKTSFTTYGASLFLAFFDDIKGAELTLTASTSQIREKEKMPEYLILLVDSINTKIE